MRETLRELPALFAEAREQGLLGPTPVEGHVDHSLFFAGLICEEALGAAPRQIADLGSGAGVPGLVIAAALPDATLLLVEGSSRRAGWLTQAVHRLGLTGRVTVVGERAEEVGRSREWRSHFDVVVARSFGRPAVTAECGAPLLRPGGRLIVSEPPERPVGDDVLKAKVVGTVGGLPADRWPSDRLARLGLSPALPVRSGGRSFVVLHLESPCPDQYPRRTGVPGRRPLF